MVYNMGSIDHPVGEVFTRVDDGRYHVVRFTRDGPNSTIQVDDLDIQPKIPTGKLTGCNFCVASEFTS